MRLGILGGTFNPPHVAHLVCAREARAQLGLDQVLLLPSRTPPHKAVPDDPGPEHRFEMCRRAAEADGSVGVLRLELDRPAPSFTVDTLRELHARAPGDELTFIVGGDMALSLSRWREPEQVLGLARLAVAERADAARVQIAAALEPLGADGRVDFFAMPRLDISSTDVRARVAAGRSVRWLVPGAVGDYIDAQRLYAAAGGPQ